MSRSRRLAAALVILGVAASAGGCSTIEATEDRVVIQYNTYYSDMAFSAAQRECARFGRTAELVATRAAEPSWRTAFTRTTISTFDCVPATPPDQSTQSPPSG